MLTCEYTRATATSLLCEALTLHAGLLATLGSLGPAISGVGVAGENQSHVASVE